VVEKPLHVEEEERGRETGGHGGMSGMDYRMDGVSCTMVIPEAKLGGRKNPEGVCIVHEAARDDAFEQLPTALQQGNGVIGFWQGVVRWPPYNRGL
jgi:hypothetical protein